MSINNGTSARIAELIVAAPGTAFSTGTSFGYRAEASLNIKPKTVKDFAKANFTYAYTVSLIYNSFQATWENLWNAYLMTYQPVIARCTEDVTNRKFYFIDDPTPASPTGSTQLGVKFKLTHNITTSTLEMGFQGEISKGQYRWLMANVAATIAGETGSTGIGIVADTYDLTNFSAPNIQTVNIENSNGARNVGANLETEFTLESTSEDQTDIRDHYTHQKFLYNFKTRVKSTVAADISELITDSEEDVVITITLTDGRQIILNNAKLNFDYDSGDSKRDCTITASAEIVQNISNVTPNAFDSGITDANILELTTTGLA